MIALQQVQRWCTLLQEALMLLQGSQLSSIMRNKGICRPLLALRRNTLLPSAAAAAALTGAA
jgi:hypothetical protein